MKHSYLHKLFVFMFAGGGMLAQTASALITIETVPVGNAGNTGAPSGYGAVGYDYRIGKYEVTLNQYTAFLNSVAATDTYGLFSAGMVSAGQYFGIARSGVSGSYTYAVMGSGNRPVTYVSWYNAARFVNWLHNGQPVGMQVAGTTEMGAYTLIRNTGLITRNGGWTYGLPNENEWYKAAYHQPVGQGGDFDNYWLYPTANNAIPNSRNGSDSDPNSANFWRSDGVANGFNDGFAVSGSASFSLQRENLTDVGAFDLASSFYGTFDQGGNAREWTDDVYSLARELRGGSWSDTEFALRASYRVPSEPLFAFDDVGFRIVMIPEPSTTGLLVLGMTLVGWKRKRMI